MTLPALVSKYKKIQTVNGVKSTISMLQQAFDYSRAREDINLSWTTAEITAEKTQEVFDRYFAHTLKTVKVCKTFTEGCFPKPYFYLNGEQVNISSSSTRVYYILANGVMISFGLAGAIDNPGATFGVAFLFDINGMKRPNTIGLDIFEVKFDEKGLVNYKNYVKEKRENFLTRGRWYNCNNKSPYGGYNCLGLMMIDGWKIKDDYPWK